MVRNIETTSFMEELFFVMPQLKFIHIEDQVSLEAGKAITPKNHVEEWLWKQAAATVEHYHSDNAVFTRLFKEPAKLIARLNLLVELA